MSSRTELAVSSGMETENDVKRTKEVAEGTGELYAPASSLRYTPTLPLRKLRSCTMLAFQAESTHCQFEVDGTAGH